MQPVSHRRNGLVVAIQQPLFSWKPFLRSVDAYAQGWAALSLLHRDRSAETQCADMHGAARAGSRNRRGGGRSGLRIAPFQGNDLCARGARASASSLASTSPRSAPRCSGSTRSGTSCFRPSRLVSSSYSSSDVDVNPDGVEIRLRTEGLANLTAELDAVRPEQKAA